jgi:hypothetical protein
MAETETIETPTETDKAELQAVAEATVERNCVPPVKWERNEFGLLKHIDYVFNEDGSVNWRKMIKPEYLVVNKKNFEKRNQKAPESIEGVDDKDLLILLGGIRNLAMIRGFSKFQHHPLCVQPGYAAIRTTVTWFPNFEWNNVSVESDGWADAHKNNTTGFTQLYFPSIAENRGFIRAVRNFLNIKIVGADEIGPDSMPEDEDAGTQENISGKAQDRLAELLKKHNVAFPNFKNRMIQNGFDAEEWTSVKNIPSDKIFDVINVTNKLLAARK